MNKNSKQNKAANKHQTGDQKVISQNEERNMQMIVLKNKPKDGVVSSITRHVPINPDKPFKPYGKKKAA